MCKGVCARVCVVVGKGWVSGRVFNGGPDLHLFVFLRLGLQPSPPPLNPKQFTL